jgi:hypothetical protein
MIPGTEHRATAEQRAQSYQSKELSEHRAQSTELTEHRANDTEHRVNRAIRVNE